MWHNGVIDFGCVNFKFSRVKVCVEVTYDPTERDGEEKERLWNDLDMIVDRVGNRYRFCILGDLNGWVGDRHNWCFWSSRRE